MAEGRADTSAPAARGSTRDALAARSRDALRRACRVPAPDSPAALAVLDDLVIHARGLDPALRAAILRDALCARLSVAAAVPIDPAAEVDPGADLRADAQLDELLALVVEQGLTLFDIDAQVLVAHRALLRGDDESALAAVSTALSHLDEHGVVDHAHSEAEHRRNQHGSYLLVARSLASLGMHENGAVLLERARIFAAETGDEEGVAAARYESVRLGLSWGLRLERAGRDPGPRLYGAAVTARAEQPGRQVVAMSGDGGLTMLLGELLTAAEHDLDLTVVAFNNGALGMIRLEMMVAGFPSFQTDHGPADLGAIATAAGLHAVTVTDPTEVRDALRTALAHRGPSLVDVRTDPDALSIPPHITAEQVRGFALAGMRTVLAGGVGRMVQLARSNLRSIPRHPGR